MAAGVREAARDRRHSNFGAIATLFAVVFALNVDCEGSDPTKGMIAAGAVGMSQPRLVYLKPGLRIAKKPPKDWTHLVFKSIPRLATGDLGTLPAGSKKTATLFRTVLLANVKPVDFNEKDFELTQVGLGLCIPDPQDEDQDIVVTADTLDALGLRHLTTVQRMVLDAAGEEMAEGRIIARTPTFALFRSPITVLDPGPAGKHSKANIHYALCVNRTTGKLDVLCWTVKPESTVQPAFAAMVRLKPAVVFQCELDVHAKRILGTVPFSWSFAMRELPPGVKLPVPPATSARIVAATRRPVDLDPDDLEVLLQQIIPTTPDAGIASDQPPLPAADAGVRRTAIPPPYRTTE
jgi:hypothetical protein